MRKDYYDIQNVCPNKLAASSTRTSEQDQEGKDKMVTTAVKNLGHK